MFQNLVNSLQWHNSNCEVAQSSLVGTMSPSPPARCGCGSGLATQWAPGPLAQWQPGGLTRGPQGPCFPAARAALALEKPLGMKKKASASTIGGWDLQPD